MPGKEMKRILFILFIFLLSFLFLPLFQDHGHLIPERPLQGFFPKTAEITFSDVTWREWKQGVFQQKYMENNQQRTGLRSWFIRIRNQVDYSLFNLLHARGFICGKQGYMFEEDYIREYTGEFFAGTSTIDSKLMLLKRLQDTLRKQNVHLLLVFEPGKASFFPEYIPSEYLKSKNPTSNYQYMIAKANELGIRYVDLNRSMLQLKNRVPYPLFPKHGMHWSIYGMHCCFDSLYPAMEKEMVTKLPRMTLGPVEFIYEERETDKDIENLSNLLFGLDPERLAYPSVSFGREGKKINSTLVVGDSYFVNVFDHQLMNGISDKNKYWYYYSTLYPDIYESPKSIDTTHLKEQILHHNLILLASSEINLHCLYWGFLDDLGRCLLKDYKPGKIADIENQIRNSREWFESIVTKARFRGRTTEEMLSEDARYIFYNQYQSIPGKTRPDSLLYIQLSILHDTTWLKSVEAKAMASKKSLDEQLKAEAVYLLDHK